AFSPQVHTAPFVATDRLWLMLPVTWKPCGFPGATIATAEFAPVDVTALPHALTVPSSNAASDRFPAPSTLRTSIRPVTGAGVYRTVFVVPSPIWPAVFSPHARTDRSEPTIASAC